MDVTASLSAVEAAQTVFGLVQMMNLTAWRYPPSCSVINGTKFDFIIVGSGTAGSVLAKRLSKNEKVSVLLIETGGYPPIEADEFPGLFVLLPRSIYDYNYIAENDNYTAQNLQYGSISLTQGKVLGGSSALHHMVHVHGNPHDYNHWSKILEDDSWSYKNILPYLKKMENLVDEELLESPYARYHGTNGPLKITREKNPINKEYLEAFEELGHNIVEDTSSPSSALGYTEPLYNIADGLRQSTALKYLGLAKSCTNICVSLFTTATKILIKNGVAIGVQATKANGDQYIFHAHKEVVISAGAVNSPKLLMLSGIGPKSHLQSLGIHVHVDLPVGHNFKDHPSAIVMYKMGKSAEPAHSFNPHVFPGPTTLGYVALDPWQDYPDYQTLNLVLPHDSPALLELCSNVVKYSFEICQKFHEANKGRTMLLVLNNLLMPKSAGKIMLASKDPNDDPLIYPGTYTDCSDLDIMARSLADAHKVIETTFFKRMNATMVDVGVCSGKRSKFKFWKCYARAMSATMWHYCGTCAMGSVLDSKLLVKGIKGLRVVDASSMPTLVRGNIHAAVVMIAERAADLIIDAWNIKHC